jgi:small subunit ribosomal protein S11
VRKKVRKNVADGVAHVHASFNNTIITITDRQGGALSWASSGGQGFKGSRKEHARSQPRWLPKWPVVSAQDQGIKNLDVRIKGPGRAASRRCVRWPSLGIRINSISDVTPVPHERLPSAEAPPHLSERRLRRRRCPSGSADFFASVE